jgi:hypothetical protein
MPACFQACSQNMNTVGSQLAPSAEAYTNIHIRICTYIYKSKVSFYTCLHFFVFFLNLYQRRISLIASWIHFAVDTTVHSVRVVGTRRRNEQFKKQYALNIKREREREIGREKVWTWQRLFSHRRFHTECLTIISRSVVQPVAYTPHWRHYNAPPPPPLLNISTQDKTKYLRRTNIFALSLI